MKELSTNQPPALAGSARRTDTVYAYTPLVTMPHPATNGSWCGSGLTRLARKALRNALREPLPAPPNSPKGGWLSPRWSSATVFLLAATRASGTAETQGVSQIGRAHV